MASTFSTTLRLELIGDGDQSGIWGQTTNTNLGTLLEQAITGVVNITMIDANYTLTNFNGVSDESRNAVLVVGGTNAAVRDIIAPLVEKLYVVRNNTLGGFGVRIIGVSGTGVTVPSGATVWVYCDGNNFNAIGTESVGNFEVNGNLLVTGNTNAVAATYTSNVAALNISTANVTATGAGSFTGNVSAANFSGAGLTITSINASNISAGTIANARTTAASANGASTIVVRDSNGSFAANVGTFTTISGDASAVSNINASNVSSGTLATARGGTGLNSFTSGGAVYATSTSALTTGTLPVASGGTGVTTSTGTGSTVLSASPTFTGIPLAPTAAVTTDNTQIATTAFVRDIIPAGIISMWSGSIATIPTGWVLCDGTNSTPDLRDRFIVGAGSTYAVNATGGSANAIVVAHTHSITDPGHIHSFINGAQTVFGGAGSGGVYADSRTVNTDSATTGVTINSTGSSGTNANLPPYFALAYIMKT